MTCKDCKKEFIELYIGDWCESCFDKGLQADMDDHFKNFMENEMKDHEMRGEK